LALIVDVPLGVVTVTSVVAAISAGVEAKMVVSETTMNEVAAVEPKLTAVAPVKPVPVIVTELAPLTEPMFKPMPVTVGAAAALYVN
jgi:hypothetical protein